MKNRINSPIRAVLLFPLFIAALLPGVAAANDNAVSAELRAQLQPVIEGRAHDSKVRAELARAYAARDFAPLWQAPAKRQQLLAEIESLADDGLNPDHYLAELLRKPLAASGTAVQRAQDDIRISEACTAALNHLQRGVLDPARAGHYWHTSSLPAPNLPSPAAQLGKPGDADLAALFNRFRPKTELYTALRKAMAEARREQAGAGLPQVSPGPTLKSGVSSARVIELRARLIASAYLDAQDSFSPQMDDTLVEAVRAFQRDQGLEADGAVGPITLGALNRSLAERQAMLRINLERSRWLAARQQGEYVLVDIAGYRLTYFRDGAPLWSARTQVGTAARETPELFSRITHFTINPTWTVPPTILRKDIIPKASTDPAYLASRNIRVLDRDGDEVDPATVDWSNTSGLTLRQDAGDGAALGKVAIRFSNPYAIYLHDTPNQRQFKRSTRAFSSGCVRVEDALDLARLLIEGNGGGAHVARFESVLASGKTGNLSLAGSVPIIIAYLTAAPDAEGRITYRPDIYSRDAELMAALDTVSK